MNRVLSVVFAIVLVLPVAASLAEAAPSDLAAPQAPGLDLWWVDAGFDADGDRIDDRIEAQIAAAEAAGEPDRLLDVIADFAYYPTALDAAHIASFGATDVNPLTLIPAMTADIPASEIEDYVAATPTLGLLEYSPTHYVSLSVSTKTIKAGPSSTFTPNTAWERGFRGEGMVVAVLDTGANNQHNYFRDLSDGRPKWIAGAGFDGTNTLCSDPTDGHGHGTHTSSTAVGNGGVNTYPYGTNSGVAPEAQLVEIQISSGADGSAAVSDMIEAWNWVKTWNDAVAAGTPLCGAALDAHIDVASLSFGSLGDGGSGNDAQSAAINNLVATGVVITVSAGNCGPGALECPPPVGGDEQNIGSPATADGAITVANGDDRNTIGRGDDQISSSSSRGPRANDGDANVYDEMKPEITAPGTSIVAASSSGTTGTTTMSGTSMAAPHIAGVAALVLQANPNCAPTSKDDHPVRDVLIRSAEYKTASSQTQTAAGKFGRSWNNAWGYGLVDADAALTEALTGTACGGVGFSARAGGPYTANAGTPTTLVGSAVGGVGPYTFEWDLDADGVFETPGATPSVTFRAGGTWTVTVRATDAAAATDTDSATVTVSGGSSGGTTTSLRTWNFDGVTNEVSGQMCDSTTDGAEDGWYWSRPIATTYPPPQPPEPGNGAPEDWHTQAFQPHSGNCSWYHGSDQSGLYGANQLTDLLSPDGVFTGACIDVPTTYDGARFRFAVAGEMEKGAEEWDYMLVQVRAGVCNSDGWPAAETTTVAKLSGVRGDLLNGVYETYEADVTALAGAGPSTIRFRAVTDANNLDCSDADPTLGTPGVLCSGYQVDTFELLGVSGGGGGTPPGAFTLGATPTGSAIDLAWTVSTNAVAYTVHRAAATGFTPTAANQIGSTTTTSFSDTSAVPGVVYHYVVVASSVDGGTRASNYDVAQRVTDDTTPPTAAVLTATDLATDGAVRLDWTAASDAESGIASYAVKRDGATIATLGGGATTYTDTGLTNGQAYAYVVAAANGGGLTADSNTATATPTRDAVAPAAPTGLVATAGNRQVALNWDDNAEADLAHYVLYRDGVAVGTATASAKLDTGLANDVQVCYTVTAVDDYGNEGAPSAAACATPTGPAQPSVAGWRQYRREPTASGVAAESAYYDTLPVPLGTASLGKPSAPVVGDLDGDGDDEVVVAVDTDNADPIRLVAFDVDETNANALVQIWSTALPETVIEGATAHGDGLVGMPVLVEGDGDAGLEVFVAYTYLRGVSGTGFLDPWMALVDSDGDILDAVEAPFPTATTNPVVANLDEDAAPEVVFRNDPATSTSGASIPESFSIVDVSNGALAQQGSFAKAGLEGAPAIADLDGDGDLEIAAGYWTANNAGGIVVLDSSGVLLKDVPLTSAPMNVAIGDLDGDATLEIVAGARSGGTAQSVLVLDSASGASGYALAASAAAGSVWGPPAIGDVDGDGLNEVVVALHQAFTNGVDLMGDVKVYDYQGGALALHDSVARPGAPDNRAPTGVLLADVDGDDGLDVLVGSRNGEVVAYDGATLDPIWTTKAGGAVVGYLAFTDAWENGEADILATTEGPTGSLFLWGSTNHRPVLGALPDLAVVEGDVVGFTVSATDADGDAITLEMSGLPEGATFTDHGDGTGTFAWTTDFADAGSHPLKVGASDGRSFTQDEVAIDVANVNRAPVLAAIGPQAVAESQTLAFALSATDEDGETLAFAMSGAPSGASLSGASFSWTPSFTQAGAYDVTFTVSDGTASDSETVTITVSNTNRPPVLAAIGAKSVDVYAQKRLAFTVSATDADGEAVTYSAENLPAGANFDASNRTFWWFPTAAQAGVYDGVRFVVTDASGGVDSEGVRITVTANSRPGVSIVVVGPTAVQTTPGATIEARFRVTNTGLATSVVDLAPQNVPSGWTATSPASVTLAPGANEVVTMTITTSASRLEAVLGLKATVPGAAARTAYLTVRLPVIVDLALDFDTYFLQTPVSGVVRATWMDGSPAVGIPIHVSETSSVAGTPLPGARTQTVSTGADGSAAFQFADDPTKSTTPGEHTVTARQTLVVNAGSSDSETYQVL